jgi:DNA-binding Lrp family transcriptional regulator
MDKFDQELLRILSRDSAISNALIGERIGLSASQVFRRRVRLENDGIITGYRADLNYKALDRSLNAFIKVRLHGHSKASFTNFKSLVNDIPEVCLACTLTGDADYLLHVRAKDLQALYALISTRLLVNVDVRQVRSDVVLDMIKDETSIDP